MPAIGIGRPRRRFVSGPQESTSDSRDCLVGLEVEVIPEQQTTQKKEVYAKDKGEMDGVPDTSMGLQKQAEEGIHFSLVDCEVDENGQTQTDKELDRRLLAIVALNELVSRQRVTIRKLKRAQTENKRIQNQTFHFRKDRSSNCDSHHFNVNESDLIGPKSEKRPSKKSIVSFGPNLDKTDEEVVCVMNCDDYESVASKDISKMERGFKESVLSIKACAKQVDTAIALDELYRVKVELESTKRRLKSRSDEVDDLRSQLEAYEHRLSTVELQRELYKGEAEMIRRQLDEILAQQSQCSNSGTPVISHLTMEELPEEDSLTTRESSNPVSAVTPDNSPLRRISRFQQQRSPDNGMRSSDVEREMGSVGTNHHSPSASPTAARHKHFNLFRSKGRAWDRSPKNKSTGETIRKKLPSLLLKKNSGRKSETSNHAQVEHRNSKLRKPKEKMNEMHDSVAKVRRYYENSLNSMPNHIVARGNQVQNQMASNRTKFQDDSRDVSSKEMEYYRGRQDSIPSLVDDLDSEPRFC